MIKLGLCRHNRENRTSKRSTQPGTLYPGTRDTAASPASRRNGSRNGDHHHTLRMMRTGGMGRETGKHFSRPVGMKFEMTILRRKAVCLFQISPPSNYTGLNILAYYSK